MAILRPAGHKVPPGASVNIWRPGPWGAEQQAPLYCYSDLRLSRSALPITETEDRLIAAAAIIGLSKMPNHG